MAVQRPFNLQCEISHYKLSFTLKIKGTLNTLIFYHSGKIY